MHVDDAVDRSFRPLAVQARGCWGCDLTQLLKVVVQVMYVIIVMDDRRWSKRSWPSSLACPNIEHLASHLAFVFSTCASRAHGM